MRKKNKCITALLAAFMIMAAFFTPMTAYANEYGEPDTVYGEEYDISAFDFGGMDLNDLTILELLESFTVSELMEMFGSFDISDFDFDDPFNESAIPDNSKPFTPDGQASVVDLAYEGDGKMFYTFRTPAGNTFYLIIDRQRGGNNVYFLNAVTEYDLFALAEMAGHPPNVPESAIPTTRPPTNTNGTGDNADDPDDKEAETPPPKKSNNGMLIFLLIGVVAVGIGGYYIKVIRPKQQAGMDDEDDDIPDEDDSDELQFENEPEEADEYEDGDEKDEGDDE
jgi:hypothetical protein